MRCYTAIERLKPIRDDWKPAISLASELLPSLKDKRTFEYNRAYTALMHEGYALFIEEERRDAHFVAIITICIMVTAVRLGYIPTPKLDGVLAVLGTLTWNAFIWSSSRFVASTLRSESALVFTGTGFLVTWLLCDVEDTKLGRVASISTIFILIILISVMLYPIIVQLLARYSIRVDWKEVRSLFR